MLRNIQLRVGKSESYYFWLLVKHCPDTTPGQKILKNFLFRRNKTGFLRSESLFYFTSKLEKCLLNLLQSPFGLTIKMGVQDIPSGKAISIVSIQKLVVDILGHSKILVSIPIQESDFKHLVFVVKITYP